MAGLGLLAGWWHRINALAEGPLPAVGDPPSGHWPSVAAAGRTDLREAWGRQQHCLRVQPGPQEPREGLLLLGPLGLMAWVQGCGPLAGWLG